MSHTHITPVDSKRMPTGIPGLDSVLRGGIKPSRLYLVQGAPGTGKTTLALQFLLEGAKRGERGLYITLSETADELKDVSLSHGWLLDDLTIVELVNEAGLDPEQEQSILHPSELELGETTREIMQCIEDKAPARIVLDSLSEMRLLANSGLRYRRQILALKHFFSHRNCTVLLLDDNTMEPGDAHLHSIVHGVIRLEVTAQDFGVERRRMRIAKMRGMKYDSGYHDMALETGGLQVFPRLVAALHQQQFEPALKSTGTPELDSLLGGGMLTGTNTLFTGPAGVGKTTTVMSCIYAALRRGERCVYYLFDERLGTLLIRCKALGMDVGDYVESGSLVINQIDPAEISPGEFAARVCAAVSEQKATFVAIDSLNAYLHSMPGERHLLLQMHELLTYLNQQGVISLVVLSQHGVVGDMRVDVDLSYVSDSVVLFRFFEAAGRIQSAVSVLKTRTSANDNSIRQLTLDANGVHVGEALKDFEGILTGAPSYRGATPLMETE